jgi:anti-anti-sigma factor
MLNKIVSDDTPSIMTAEINHNTIVVRVHTMQIDEGNRLLFEEELFCSARTNSPLSLVLDLEQVTFLSSSSLSSLVRLRLECIERSQKVLLVGLSHNVKEVFRITKLNKSFESFVDVASAMQWLEANV